MIGKKNIVFGLVFFIFSAVLGIPMTKSILEGNVASTGATRDQAMGQLEQFVSEGFQVVTKTDIKELDNEEIHKALSNKILALNKSIKTRQNEVNDVRNVHAHGNLESLLNIVVGVLLCFIGISRLFKQLISWAMMLGALCHAGMLYISVVLPVIFNVTTEGGDPHFVVDLATKIIYAGPPLLLLGMVLACVGVVMGFRGEPVID